MSREPLVFTLEEAIVAVTGKGMWLEAHRLNDGRTEWTVWHEPNPSDLYQPASGLVCHATVYTWPDAVSAALGVPVVERDDKAELIAQLAECFRLSGADPDGNEDWRLAPRAVMEVRQLREEYDALMNREAELVKALRMALESLDAIEPPQEWDCRPVLRAALAAVREEQ